jgi:lysophosphatidylcholine acyltransferase/lyso-PAF acetyltransferase
VTAPYHLFRFLTQFVNYCELVMLPVYTPSAAEKADPQLFADNVRAAMSKASGLPMSEADVKDKREYLQVLRGRDAKLE